MYPGQSCQIAIKLSEPINRDEYPNVVMELTANNAFQHDVRLTGQGVAKFTLQWEQNHWQDKSKSNQKTKGFLKQGFPIIGDYTHQFTSYGFLGFIFNAFFL